MQPMVAVSNPAAQSGYRDNALQDVGDVLGAEGLEPLSSAMPLATCGL